MFIYILLKWKIANNKVYFLLVIFLLGFPYSEVVLRVMQ